MRTPSTASDPDSTRRRPRVVTIGSINMDLVVRMAQLPRPGETRAGEDLTLISGGKGANQAVAAARLGAESLMVGRVGDDPFGGRLLEELRSCGVDARHVRVENGCSSGVAIIAVDAAGENSITIISGANGRLGPSDLEPLDSLIASADALLLQLEIPLETVSAAIDLARRHKVLTVLDPAPVPSSGLPEALFGVDLLTPNQTEAAALTGLEATDLALAEAVGGALIQRGARRVIIKLGPDGALLLDPDQPSLFVPAFEVSPVDTTAAGDAFNAAVAVALAGGKSWPDALRFGCAAGALTVTRFGAQPALPSREETERLVATGRERNSISH